jgi:hypothetical protein
MRRIGWATLYIFFRVHHLVNLDDRHLLAHAMTSDFQPHGSFSQREQLFFHYGSNSTPYELHYIYVRTYFEFGSFFIFQSNSSVWGFCFFLSGCPGNVFVAVVDTKRSWVHYTVWGYLRKSDGYDFLDDNSFIYLIRQIMGSNYKGFKNIPDKGAEKIDLMSESKMSKDKM